MNRRRQSSRTLTGSRIYLRDGSYKYFAPEPILNPTTGRVAKWHTLCKEADGELRARQLLDALIGKPAEPKGAGDFGVWFGKWRAALMIAREAKAPRDPVRVKIWRDGTKSLESQLRIVETAFVDFDLQQVQPKDVAEFVDQWAGRRSAQSYLGHLRKFFAWCCRKGLLSTNAAREIKVDKPPKHDVYITDAQYLAIKRHLLIGKDKRPTRTGEMVGVYMDLLFLLYQRGTDVRLLRWDEIKDDGILFKPTKTEASSGAKVLVPIGPDIKAVLERAKAIKKMRSIYVIHTEHGQPYTAHGIGSLFERACDRAGIEGVTLKDIRAKAATDAKRQGYSIEQLKTAMAHTDAATTRDYVRSREVPVSEVVLRLPR
jgi:integrase